MHRWLAITGIAIGLAACSGTAQRPVTLERPEQQLVRCEEPRPTVCTMEYRPVCATLGAGGQKTYASGCNACADVAVISHLPNACDTQ